MKLLLTTFLLAAMMGTAFAQLNVWGPAVPFSDSINDNTDATLKELDYYGGLDFYVFWVRSEDSASSDIVTRRFYNTEDPITVLSDGMHHFRNPQIIPIQNWNAPDTLFALFYEADLDGDFDIYYCFYTPMGFTTSTALTENEQDDEGLSTNNAGGIIWEKSDTIYFTSLLSTGQGGPIAFDSLMLVDYGNCSNPSLAHNGIGGMTECLSWEKIIDDTSRIMIKKMAWGTGIWQENEVISTGGMNTHPQFSEGTFSEIPSTLCWNMFSDDSCAIYASDLENMYFLSDFRQILPFNTHCYNIFIGVDWFWEYSIVTFEEEAQADIYGGQWGFNPLLDNYVNLSNSSAIDRNPYLFEGTFIGDWEDVINIWESYRNGHWQLYTAKIPVQIWGGISEPGDMNAFNLKAIPNPATEETKVCFDLDNSTTAIISLVNINGRKAKELDLGRLSSAHYEIPLKALGILKPGSYVLVLEAEGKRQGIKLLIQ